MDHTHTPRCTHGSSRRNWTQDETFALLDAYTARKKEFMEPRKKMIAFHNILVELQAKGILAEHTTTDMLKSRMSSLKRKYLQYVSTSPSPPHCNFPYYRIMTDLIKTTMSGIASRQPIQDEIPRSGVVISPIEDDINENERMWSESETFELLRAYSAHREEFIANSKNKEGFQNVLCALNDSDVLESPVTIAMIRSKMKDLQQAYANYLAADPTAPQIAFPYYELMKALFGSEIVMVPGNNVIKTELEVEVDDSWDWVNAETNDPLEANRIHSPVTGNIKEQSSNASQMQAVTATKTVEISRSEFYKRSLEIAKEKLNQRKKHFAKMERNKDRRHAISEAAKERRHKEKLDLLTKVLKNGC